MIIMISQSHLCFLSHYFVSNYNLLKIFSHKFLYILKRNFLTEDFQTDTEVTELESDGFTAPVNSCIPSVDPWKPP